MKIISPNSPPGAAVRLRYKKRGIALVITLILLVVVTVIITAFFSRALFDSQATATYSSGVQSDLLAAGALDKVVGHVVSEVVTNSDVKTSGALTWFEPKKVGNIYPSMIPLKPASTSIPTDASFRNLIRQSSDETDFATGASSVASNVKSNTPSTDGRSISASRWDLPKLLGDETGPAKFGAGTVPKWIYLKSNDQTTAADTDGEKIVGRYAYNVYNVGGLININVAGNNAAPAQDVSSKGALAFADLTAIPGLNSTSVATILGWRAPYVNWTVSGDPNNPTIPNGSLSLMDYLRVGAASGWLRNPSTSSTQRGNQFLSRLELIKFFEKNNLSDNALPYLTHFNVDLNAPTFSPDSDILKVLTDGFDSMLQLRESKQSGRPVSSAQKEINPQRWADVATQTSATGKSESAPILFKRFPLSRLAYVKTDPAIRLKTSSDAITTKYFGLKKNNEYTWQYSDLEGSTDHIKTLQEVAAEQVKNSTREPNFFEILKSMIQVGSLGQHKQTTVGSPNAIEPFANLIDEHVLKIGAAIIDQADEDSLPTRILFNDTDGTSTSYGEIYGVEDIPYLYFIRTVAYRRNAVNQPNNRSVMIQPSLWNPHNPFRSNAATGAEPSDFKIVANSVGPIRLGGVGWTKIPPKSFSGDWIKFHWTPTAPTTAQPNFYEPQGILSATYPTTAMPITVSDPSTMTRSLYDDATHGERVNLSGLGNPPTALGFLVGDTGNTSATPDNTQLQETCNYLGGPVEFLLKYAAPDGAEYTYDRLWFAPQIASVIELQTPGNPQIPFYSAVYTGGKDQYAKGSLYWNGTADTRIDAAYAKTDPRSQRFMWGINRARFTDNKTAAATWAAFPEGASTSFYDGVVGKVYAGPMGRFDEKLWTFGNRAENGATASLGSDYYRTDLGFLVLNKKIKNPNGERGICYKDPDGVIRRGLVAPAQAIFFSTQDVTYLSFTATNQPRNVGFPYQRVNADQTSNGYMNRPVVLNRPFRSVGELAYAFRDVPWKNIDLSLPESADTGLLDVFSVNEEADSTKTLYPLTADRINLNVCPVPVLKAMIAGAAMQIDAKSGSSANFKALTPTQESTLANRIDAYRSASTGTPSETVTSVNGPLRSLSEMVGRVYGGTDGASATFSGLHPEDSMGSVADDKILPERISAVSRALTDMSTVRTWNLMIDLVAQTGSAKKSLDKFTVKSESRYWLFVSVDRFTGKILSRSLERIVE